MSHTIKFGKKVIVQRLEMQISISLNQFGFMHRRFNIEVIYILR